MPNAHFERDFILEYRAVGGDGKQLEELFLAKIPEVQIDAETNRRFTVVKSKVKATFVNTKVTDAGTGKYLFHDHDYTVFVSMISR